MIISAPRIKSIIFSVTLLIVIVTSIILYKNFQSHTTNSGGLPVLPKGYQWKQVFDDEFNGNALDTSKWTTCYEWYSSKYNGCSNNGNNELEWYTPSQVSVRNGSAVLQAVATPIQGFNSAYEQTYPYQSGMISTGKPNEQSSPNWTGTYGYYEARMRVPSGAGLWPAFWLLPTGLTWPPEIDIMELIGSQPQNVTMTYHWKGSNGTPQKDYTIYSGSNFTEGWHTYAIDWEPGRIDWYIDGVKRKSVTSPNVPSTPMQIIFDLAVGGNLPGLPNNKTTFPAQAEIDWVRVYYQVHS